MFWVYILECADGNYYTGHTDNLEKRMGQYHAGECEGYVATRRPVKLAWSQECTTRYDALSAERQIKGWSRKKKEAMMRADWDEVSRLAQNKSKTVRGEPDKTTSHSTKPTSRQVAGYVEPHATLGKSAHPSTISGRTDLPSPLDTVRPDPSTLLRTKGLAEGHNAMAVRGELVEPQVAVVKSIHPSTGSERTDLPSPLNTDLPSPLNTVRLEPVEGQNALLSSNEAATL